MSLIHSYRNICNGEILNVLYFSSIFYTDSQFMYTKSILLADRLTDFTNVHFANNDNMAVTKCHIIYH
jgi:hypothetical protein